MKRTRTAIRNTQRSLPTAALLAVLVLSITASPVCAMSACGGRDVAMAEVDHAGHSCCPEPCGAPEKPAKDCNDTTCVMHSSDAPAEPASTMHVPVFPQVSLGLVLDVAKTTTLIPTDPPDRGGGHYLTLSAPLHILISQYLI